MVLFKVIGGSACSLVSSSASCYDASSAATIGFFLVSSVLILTAIAAVSSRA